MKFKKLYLTMLLLPSIAIGASTKGIKYIDGSGPTNPAAMVCANSSTPLPIVISTLRDFGITSIYKNRVLVTIEAIYWTEKERGVPLKFASFFGDTEVNWPGKPSFGDGSSGHSVSQIPLSARFMNGMSVADAGLGGTSKLDHKRKFEPYYSQVEYLKSRYFYIIKYRPGVQFGEYGVRQPDEIIWLPTRSIKSLKIKVEDKNSPPRPEISNITAFVAFTWTAKSGYNPKSMDPPILELSNVEMSGWDKENGGNYSTAIDPDLHVQYLANLSAKVSMSLGEKYTLAANWSRIPDIRNLVENTNYSKQYRVARDAFGALNVNFPSLFHGIERGEKFPGYDLNLRKVDFIYANLDLIENNLHEFGYKNYVQTYFRGSINAYNNVYIDEDQYRRDGSVLDICN
ncbi:hypothetical protein [Providencia sp.]|jgi:hypothetical protein|uniref:hypothetical protein n=1 Tax=Providencia sp. TaxID=589 RepID=UPI00281CA7F4|nr:hypothetical protein [Providencia sp.]